MQIDKLKIDFLFKVGLSISNVSNSIYVPQLETDLSIAHHAVSGRILWG